MCETKGEQKQKTVNPTDGVISEPGLIDGSSLCVFKIGSYVFWWFLRIEPDLTIKLAFSVGSIPK